MKALVNIDKIAKINIVPKGEKAELTIQIGADGKMFGDLSKMEWQQLCYRLGVITNGYEFDGAEDHLSQMALYVQTLKTQADSIDALRGEIANLNTVASANQEETVKLLQLVDTLEKEKVEFAPQLEAANAEIFALKEARETQDTALKSADETIEQLKRIVDDLQAKVAAGQNLIDMGEAKGEVSYEGVKLQDATDEPDETPVTDVPIQGELILPPAQE